MAAKQKVTFAVHPVLADQFRQMSAHFYGKLSLCFSAALVQFLETAPEAQAAYIQRVFEAELRDEVAALVDAVKAEQARRVGEHKRRRPK